ncbi:hypothetical protein FB45DRAFT_898539 [Roridomyces roridus]|uniref:Uncharacterized protein n=1 Tax=Roridomyces roridus TaxID=1738132 RepID=A0AAD7CC30_9AGAR|nr:hypothetical protein FB45DRAFT_898539 [Roridomyces roridus]
MTKLISDGNLRGVMETADSVEWVDSILLKLCSMLWQSQPNHPTLAPSYPTAIAEYPGEPVLCSLWKVLALSGRLYQKKDYEPVLDAVENSGWASSAITMSVGFSVIALLKGQILEALNNQYYDPHVRITSRLLPAESAIQAINMDNNAIIAEALVAHLGAFLAEVPLISLPYRPAETIKFIGNRIFICAASWVPSGANCAGVHKQHQNRLADGLARICDASATYGELLDAVLASPMFDLCAGTRETAAYTYTEPVDRPSFAWLDDQAAREKIRNTLTAYADHLVSLTDDSPSLPRVRAILAGLESLHASTSDQEISENIFDA